MKNGIIITKKTTCTSRVEVDYLDELSPKKQRQLREKAEVSAVGEKLKQFNDYADKDNLGRVYVGGFFHRKVSQNPDGTFTIPANLPKEEVKRRLLKSWQQHLRIKGPPEGIVQHRFVVSMSKEQHDLWVKYGINPDTVLHERVRLVMQEFRKKFHAGDSVGYAYGLHHDTGNLHAHVAVCPRSEKQQRVGLSEQLKGRKSQSRHKNQLAFIKQVCARENEKVTQSFSTFAERVQLLERVKQRDDAIDWLYLKPKLPPPLATADDRETYDEMKKNYEQTGHYAGQFYEQRKSLRNAVSVLAHQMMNPLPQEPQQVKRICAALMGLFSLARQVRQSQRGWLHNSSCYFRFHYDYYHPESQSVSYSVRHSQGQRLSIH
jgi:hypothetical protein